MGPGKTQSPRTDFQPATGDAHLPRARSVDHGGGGEGTQSVLLGMFLPTRQGSVRLFRVAGIDVFLNWTWLLGPIYFLQYQRGLYPSLVWIGLEYLCLFAIVLMHEFGHALACRQMGGSANEI